MFARSLSSMISGFTVTLGPKYLHAHTHTHTGTEERILYE